MLDCQAVANALEVVLSRYEELGPRLGYPGDFGERAFRFWLVADVLMPVCHWPTERIVMGEVYDVLLLDRRRMPAITIETKPPGHRVTKQDVAKFEGRLQHYSTLRYAFFTDGRYWRRLEVAAPRGTQRLVGEIEARVDDAGGLCQLLKPLDAELY
jgi:hypothetical protein